MKTCIVAGCEGQFLARGYCNKHYKRVRINNSLDVTPAYAATRASPDVRFWSRVEKTNTCWIWKGSTYRGPRLAYGRIEVNGKAVPAHRFAYELLVGPIPDGLTIDHLCRNPSCVNPDHLEPVTLKVNLLRGTAVSAIAARKTHCPRGHAYTPENTRVYRNKRHCRACQPMHEAKSKVMKANRKALEARKEQSNG